MLDREGFETRIFSYYLPLQRVREFVDRNLSEPIPLRTAARAAGLEEKYFSAFFHRKTGVCFRDWLAGRRVERAIEILKQRDDTITSVAASVGFQDLRTFERAFKRLTGVTPREFKRSVAPEILAVADSGSEEGGTGGGVQRLDDPLDRLHVLAPWFHGSPPDAIGGRRAGGAALAGGRGQHRPGHDGSLHPGLRIDRGVGPAQAGR